MSQTDKDLLAMLDKRRKALGISWTHLAKEAKIGNSTVYRWFGPLRVDVYLNTWLQLVSAAGGRALLRTQDGREYNILANNGTVNVPALSKEAERKGTMFYKLALRLGLGSGLVYNWATGVSPTLRSLSRVLEALDMTVAIRWSPGKRNGG